MPGLVPEDRFIFQVSQGINVVGLRLAYVFFFPGRRRATGILLKLPVEAGECLVADLSCNFVDLDAVLKEQVTGMLDAVVLQVL